MRCAQLDSEGQFERWCSTDESGALLIRGPNVFKGYLDPEQDKASWVFAESERWFNSGDLARQDSDQFFWLTGRAKELIIRGGHNIDPGKIESAAYEHDAVALAAAVGRPDAHAGEIPVLYVQLHNDRDVSENTLSEFVVSRIGEPSARPKYVRIVESIPLTAVGKIFKPQLVMWEIESVVRQTAMRHGIELTTIDVHRDQLGEVTVFISTSEKCSLEQDLSLFAFRTVLTDAPQ